MSSSPAPLFSLPARKIKKTARMRSGIAPSASAATRIDAHRERSPIRTDAPPAALAPTDAVFCCGYCDAPGAGRPPGAIIGICASCRESVGPIAARKPSARLIRIGRSQSLWCDFMAYPLKEDAERRAALASIPFDPDIANNTLDLFLWVKCMATSATPWKTVDTPAFYRLKKKIYRDLQRGAARVWPDADERIRNHTMWLAAHVQAYLVY